MTKRVSLGCCAAVLAALAIGLMTAGSVSTPAYAEGAWCAEQGGRSGYTNCGYYTYRQCMASVSGVGGFCRQNSAVMMVPDVLPYGDMVDPGYRSYRRYYR